MLELLEITIFDQIFLKDAVDNTLLFVFCINFLKFMIFSEI
jgi:hypothetical protein